MVYIIFNNMMTPDDIIEMSLKHHHDIIEM